MPHKNNSPRRDLENLDSAQKLVSKEGGGGGASIRQGKGGAVVFFGKKYFLRNMSEINRWPQGMAEKIFY